MARPPADAGAESDEAEGARSPSAADAGTGKARGPKGGRTRKSHTPGAPLAAGNWGSGTGLTNLTNTCYMNAVTQAVVACGAAVRRVAEETVPQATELRRRTQELVREMLRTRGAEAGWRPMVWSPREFWRAVRSACPTFDNTRRHDAPEFFLALRRELARQPFETEPSPAWASWLAEPELHFTEHRSCTACPYTKNNLPRPNQPKLEPERVVMVEMRQGARYANMMEAIADWTGPKPDPTFRCDECGSVEGTQVKRPRQLPRVLVVWLKRFHQARGAAARRIDAAVHGLEEDLDFAAHLDATAGLAGGEQATPVNGTRYRTRAIVCHHEKERHYTCWVRAAAGFPGDAWVQYDDSTVGQPRGTLPPSVASDALLLFYEQIPDGAADRAQPAGPGPDLDNAPERAAASGADPRTLDLSDEESRNVEMTEAGEGQGGGDGAEAAGEGDENDQSDGEDAMDTS